MGGFFFFWDSAGLLHDVAKRTKIDTDSWGVVGARSPGTDTVLSGLQTGSLALH